MLTCLACIDWEMTVDTLNKLNEVSRGRSLQWVPLTSRLLSPEEKSSPADTPTATDTPMAMTRP